MKFFEQAPHRVCGAYSGAALINFFVPNAALIRGRRLFGGGAYSSKYGTPILGPRIFEYCSSKSFTSNLKAKSLKKNSKELILWSFSAKTQLSLLHNICLANFYIKRIILKYSRTVLIGTHTVRLYNWHFSNGMTMGNDVLTLLTFSFPKQMFLCFLKQSSLATRRGLLFTHFSFVTFTTGLK